MDDLFEKLKAEPPVNPILSPKDKGQSPTTTRRESFPSSSKPKSTISPTKCRSESPTTVKTVIDDVEKKEEEKSVDIEIPKKQMPTKAQKKLFEPVKESIVETIKPEIKVKSCRVRIKRDNLEKLKEKFRSENVKKSSRKSSKILPQETPDESPETSPKESPRESPKTSPRESPETSPQESLKVSPKASSRESPKTLPKESPEASPQKSLQVSPKASSRESPKTLPKESESPETSPQKPLKVSTKASSRESPKTLPKESPETSPQKLLKVSTKASPRKSPKTSPRESPETSPQKSLQVSPEASSPESPETSPKESPKASSRESPETSLKESPKTSSEPVNSSKSDLKRKAENDESPPAKKGRAKNEKKTSKTKEKSPSLSPKSGGKKSSTGFHIRLSSSASSAKKATSRKREANSSESSKSTVDTKSPVSKQSAKSPTKKQISKSPANNQSSKNSVNRRSSKAQSPLNSSDSTTWTTKATKFTRSQLIKDFGKRFFKSIVKIKRCKHPLMLTFETNASMCKQQSKNKSKNLSVSFKEQVEIIGCSDTESNYSEENPAAKKSDENTKIATPACLDKVENGKVVDDIEFDSNLILDSSNSSTPLRTKPEKKSYSPLKDDSPSARSEQLKMANEKLPPCGLRRLRDSNAEDDDDDELQQKESIVPMEIPEKRSSRSDSLNNTTVDSNASTKGSDDVDNVLVENNVCEIEKSEKIITDLPSSPTTTNSTTNSFKSAIQELNPVNKQATGQETDQNGSLKNKDLEITEKENDKTIEEVKENEKENGTMDTNKNHDKTSNNKNNVDQNDSVVLILEDDDSSPICISDTLDSQENKSDDKTINSNDKLSPDVEMKDLAGDDKRENGNSLKNICDEKVDDAIRSS